MFRTFIILSFLALSYIAEGQYTISGKVKNSQDEPLAGASLFLDSGYKGAITGPDGRFKLSGLKTGDYILNISFIGYKTEKLNVVLESDREILIVLEKSPLGLEEVVVKASRAGINDPIAMDMVGKGEIETRNFGQDIPVLLSMTPSLVSTTDAGNGIGYSSFRIRGTDANRINITIDGIPLNDAESHGVWWVNMPDLVSSVEDIQVQRGVGTSTNGAAAFGASVNLRTGSVANKPYAETRTGFGSFNSWRTTNSIGTGLLDNGLSFDLRYSRIGSDGYIERASTALRSMMFTAGYYSGKNLIKFNYISGSEKTYQAWDGVPGYILPDNRRYNGIGYYVDEYGNEKYYDNETDNYSQDHLQLHYTRELTKTLWLTYSLHYTYGRGYYEQYKEDESLSSYLIPDVTVGDTIISESDLIRQKWLDNDFYGNVFSLNYKSARLEANLGWSYNKYLGNHFGEVIWARYSSVAEKGYRWYEGKGTKTDHNVFLKTNFSLNENLSLYGDIQSRIINYRIEGIDDDLRDISQDHHFSFINPKLGINYNISPNSRAFLSFAIASREPNRDNYVDADPAGPEPVEETLFDYEGGYSMSFSNLRSELNLYFMDYNNQLVLTGEINDVGSPVMTNVKDSYRAGIEWAVHATPVKRLELDFNISLSRNIIREMTSYVDNWDYYSDPATEPYQYSDILDNTKIAFSPSVVTSGMLSYELYDNLFLRLSNKYVGKQYIDNTASEERKLDPWFVTDLVFNYHIKSSFSDKIDFNLMISNLFDHDYESNAWVYRYVENGIESKYDGFYPQAGIHFMAGIGFRF